MFPAYTKAEARDTALVRCRRQDQIAWHGKLAASGRTATARSSTAGYRAMARGAVAGPWRVARRLARSLSPSPRGPSAAGLDSSAPRRAAQGPGRAQESVAGTDGSSETARVRPAPSPLPVHVLPPAPRAAGQGAGRADAAPVPFPHAISSWPRRAVTV